MSRPAMTMWPSVGESSAPMRFSSVVFPLPDGPSTTMNSPRPTFSVTSSSAVTTFAPTWKRRLTPVRGGRAG